MNTPTSQRCVVLGLCFLAAIIAGCTKPPAGWQGKTSQTQAKPKKLVRSGPGKDSQLADQRKQKKAPGGEEKVQETPEQLGYEEPALPEKAKLLAKHVYFEKGDLQRRVLVQATVCRREGQLEGFLTKRGKEHEYILVTEADARAIHLALLATGAKPGSPVKYTEDSVIPPKGTRIKVSVQFQRRGKVTVVPASQWIKNGKNGKDLHLPWVFAGSRFWTDPEGKDPPVYTANGGDVICTCNMPDAMLDLPIDAPTALEDRVWYANKRRIPPEDTKVLVILEPDPSAEERASASAAQAFAKAAALARSMDK